MPPTLRITRRAVVEIARADTWWRENRTAVPFAVREDLKSAFELLVKQPAVGTKVINARLFGVRRVHLRRIRYFVYYRGLGQELVILSVWHSSRQTAPSL